MSWMLKASIEAQEESTWEQEDMEEGEGPSMHGNGMAENRTGGGVDAGYIQMFILKYVCPEDECGGTLVPLLGTEASKCNMCGRVRTETELMAELESYTE